MQAHSRMSRGEVVHVQGGRITNLIRETLSHSFLVRALAGGVMVSLHASLLGVNLVFGRHSMIGDGLSHISFGALSIALAMGWSPLRISIPVMVLAIFFLFRIMEGSRTESDATIALISASALTLGIIVTSLTTGVTTDVNSYMFESILATSREDVWLSVVLPLVVLGLPVIYYSHIFTVTSDESFVKATGINMGRYDIIIAVLMVVAIVLGVKMMGATLISGLVTFPCLSSMRVFKNFGGVIVSSDILSPACLFAGMVASYQFSMPARASVMVVSLYASLLPMAWQSLDRLRG